MAEQYSAKVKLSVDKSSFDSGMKSAAMSVSDVMSQSKGASGGFAKMGIAFAATQKLIAAGARAISSCLGSAISRFDTLNNYNKVMSSLGFSMEQAEASSKKLVAGIDGLPTRLDDISKSTQMLTATLGDLDKGTSTAIAVNDMFLAAGRSAEEASAATQMYNKMLAKGKADMMVWQSINVAAPGQLKQVAEAMLGAGTSTEELRQAINNGTVSMADFNDAVIKLDKEGADGIRSFAEQAQDATGGIGTSLANIKTAIVNGIANSIKTLNKSLEEANLPTIVDSLKMIKGAVKDAFNSAQKSISKAVKVAAPALKFLGRDMDLVKVAATAMAATMVAGKATAYAKGVITTSKAILALSASYKAAAVAGKTQEMAELAAAGAISAKAVVLGILSGQTTIAAGAQQLLNNAMAANPVGAVIIAFTALTTVFMGLQKAYEKLHPEIEENRQKQKDLAASYEEVSSSAAETSEEISRSKTIYDQHKSKVSELVTKFKKLNSIEQRSEDQAAELAGVVGQLNGEFDDLGLVYDDITGKVNMTNEALEAQIKHMQALEDISEYAKEYTAAMDEEAKVAEELAKHEENLARIKEEGVQMYVKTSQQYQKEVDNEQAKIDELKAKQQEFAAAAEEASTKRAEAEKAAAENIAQSIDKEKLTLDMLSEENQSTVNELTNAWSSYAEAARDMFDTLSDKQTMSVDQMIANMQENQRVISEMGTNMESLRTRFDQLHLTQGILDDLSAMGPDAAGYIAALSTASDTQLSTLASSWESGGTVAKDSLIKGMGLDSTELPDGVAALIDDTEQSLREKIEATDWTDIGKSVPDGVAEGISGGIESVSDSGTEMADAGETAVRDDWKSHSPSKVFENIGKSAPEGLAKGMKDASAKRAATKMAQEITKAVKQAMSKLSSSLNSSRVSFAGIEQSTNASMTKVKSTITSNMNASESVVKSKLNAISSAFKNLKITSNLSAQVAAFKADIARNMAQVTAIANQQMAALNKAMSGGTNVGFKNGQNIGQGFYKGMESWLGRIKQMASRYVGAVNGTIRVTGHIGSPSKLTRKLGSWMGEGYVIGLERQLPYIEKLAEKMTALSESITFPEPPRSDFDARLSFAGIGALEVEDAGFGSFIEDLAEIINERPIQVETQLDINGREFARATTPDINAEQESMAKIDSYTKGIKQ